MASQRKPRKRTEKDRAYDREYQRKRRARDPEYKENVSLKKVESLEKHRQIADLLKFMDVQRGFVLQQLISDQSREDIDLEVFKTSMPTMFHLRLCFQFPDHRFNEHPLFQQHLIGHR